MLRQGGDLAYPLPVGNGSGDNAGTGTGRDVRFVSRQRKYNKNSRLEDFSKNNEMKQLTTEMYIVLFRLT